jgi:NAD+ synthase (glutamine-hydrolysing)
MKVLAAQLNPILGDLEGNTQKILQALDRAKKRGVDVVLFPELTITGYCPEDLLLSPSFIEAAAQMLNFIQSATEGLFVAVGLPTRNLSKIEKPLYNSAAIFVNGQLLGFKHKTLLPTYDVFDERRFFEPGKEELVWEYLGYRIAVTICEDLWQHSGSVEWTQYRIDPVLELKQKGCDLILNLSASPYYYLRKDKRLSVFQAVAKTLVCPLILCNQAGANDQLVFDGYSLYLNEKGELMQIGKGFAEDDLIIDLNTHACPCSLPKNGIKDLHSALVLAVRDYFHKQGFKKAIIGLSGGIDSALVACIAKEALGAENLLGVALPSRYSSKNSVSDARLLSENLKIEFQEIDIDPLFQNYLDLLQPLFQNLPSDLTEENLQARIRATLLMALANKLGYILLNTSNKSEMAMGYATLYGDMAGGFGVLQDVTKHHVYQLASFVNEGRELIPQSIIDKIPSAELRENQTDFDSLPPYEVLDALIEDYIEQGCSAEEIAQKRNLPLEFVSDLIHKIHLAEYKRRQAPLGVRVTQKAFGKGRFVPVAQGWK